MEFVERSIRVKLVQVVLELVLCVDLVLFLGLDFPLIASVAESEDAFDRHSVEKPKRLEKENHDDFNADFLTHLQEERIFEAVKAFGSLTFEIHVCG